MAGKENCGKENCKSTGETKGKAVQLYKSAVALGLVAAFSTNEPQIRTSAKAVVAKEPWSSNQGT